MFYTEKEIQDIHESATGMLQFGNTRIGWLCSDWLTLMEQRDEKAQWVTELQVKLAQALAALNADYDRIRALEAERDAAQKALLNLYHFALEGGAAIAPETYAAVELAATPAKA